jgi:glutaredoxin
MIPKKGLFIITTKNCPPCIYLKNFLRKNNKEFREQDANYLPPELKPMLRGGLPIIIKDGGPLMTKDKKIITSGTIPYDSLLELLT